MLSPELQQQWHVDKNMHLGPIRIRPHCHFKAVWQCNKCPAGQPNVWTAAVYSTMRGSQYYCPFCCNRLVCLHNSLAAIAPDVARYRNHNRNRKASVQVLAGSKFRAEWKWSACNWEWQALRRDRVLSSAGCPKCSQALKGHQRQPTFAEAQPACLAGWDYERNIAEGFCPDKVTRGSNKLVHWICSCCPRGQPPRVGHGKGFSVCAGQQACVCNSLEPLYTCSICIHTLILTLKRMALHLLR